jgi:hypothetical protein
MGAFGLKRLNFIRERKFFLAQNLKNAFLTKTKKK